MISNNTLMIVSAVIGFGVVFGSSFGILHWKKPSLIKSKGTDNVSVGKEVGFSALFGLGGAILFVGFAYVYTISKSD